MIRSHRDADAEGDKSGQPSAQRNQQSQTKSPGAFRHRGLSPI